MPNRSMMEKARRATKQRIEAGLKEYDKAAWIASDADKGSRKETLRALIATLPADQITKCDPGKASGLHKDIGTCGKTNRFRATKCYGNGERRTNALVSWSSFNAIDQSAVWPIVTR